MSALERDWPEHAEFLKWHNEVISQYSGRVRLELWHAARIWVVNSIRLEQWKSSDATA